VGAFVSNCVQLAFDVTHEDLITTDQYLLHRSFRKITDLADVHVVIAQFNQLFEERSMLVNEVSEN
jgi:hypothetical protein